MALAAAKGGYISDMSWVGVDADPPFAKVEHPYLQAAWNRHVYGIL